MIMRKLFPKRTFIVYSLASITMAGTLGLSSALAAATLQGSTLNFNAGGSQVLENGNLVLKTDDVMSFDALQVETASNFKVGGRLIVSNHGRDDGTAIYKDGDLHIATNDNIWFDASMVTTRDDLTVGDDLTVKGDFVAKGGVDLPSGVITSAMIANGTVTGTDLLDGTVNTDDIAADAIAAGDIATGAVTTTELLDSTVASADIAADTIVAADIAASAVTTTEILDATIAGGDLSASLAITTSGASALNGGITVDTTNFTVSGTTGDVVTAGDLTVNGGDLAITGKSAVGPTTAGNIYFDTDDANLYVYDGTAWRDLTAGAAGSATLDDAYNTSAGASTVLVDNGDLTFRSNAGATGDIIVDLASTSDFVLQDNGTDVVTFSDSGNLTMASGTLALNNDTVTSDGDLSITGATGANLIATLNNLDLTSTAGKVILTAGESSANSLQITSSIGGIDIAASGAAAGEDIDITATGSSVNITATEAVVDAIVLNASTALGGIDITSNNDIDITTTGAAGEDIGIVNTGGSINLSATEDAPDAITIATTVGGIDITAAGDTAGDDLDIVATGAATEIRISTASTTADAFTLTTSAGGIDINADDGITIDAAGAAGEDIVVTNTGGSISLVATEAATDAIVLNASTALGGIDIISNEDIDITTTGAAGEDITILNTGGSVIVRATESAVDSIWIDSTVGGIDITASGAAAGEDIDITATGSSVNITSTEGATDAIVLNASTAGGGIDFISNEDIDISTTGAAGEDITVLNTGGSVIVRATESAADSIVIESTLGGVDILASGAAAGEDIDITATGSSVNISSTENVVDAIVLTASAGGINIAATGAATEDITLINTGGSVLIRATESAVDSIWLNSTTGGIDITASGAAAGEDIDIVATGSSVNLSATEDAPDAITIATTVGGIDITAAGDTAGDDLDIVATGAATEIRISTASTTADAFTLTTSAGGIDINADDGITIDAAGAAGEDIVVTNTGGSISLVATEAATDAIVLNASTALGGIDIISNEDIDITTTGAAGEDIGIVNTGGSVNIAATESINNAITITASGTNGAIVLAAGEAAGTGTNGTVSVISETVFDATANISFATDTQQVDAPGAFVPASTFLELINDTAGSIAITLSETGARDGQLVIIHATAASTSNITLADTDGTQETTGALTLTAQDTVTFIYSAADSEWVQLTTVQAN